MKEKTILRILTQPDFREKKIPGAPGVKTGDFMQNAIWRYGPFAFTLLTRDPLQDFFFDINYIGRGQ